MKRLIKKSKHDWDNRDLAIVYVNGEVYEDAIHGMSSLWWETIQALLRWGFILHKSTSFLETDFLDEEIYFPFKNSGIPVSYAGTLYNSKSLSGDFDGSTDADLYSLTSAIQVHTQLSGISNGIFS